MNYPSLAKLYHSYRFNLNPANSCSFFQFDEIIRGSGVIAQWFIIYQVSISLIINFC
jgi:hypothetical protein